MKFIESLRNIKKKQMTWWQWVVVAILMMIALLLLLHVLIGPLIYTNDTESARAASISYHRTSISLTGITSSSMLR